MFHDIPIILHGAAQCKASSSWSQHVINGAISGPAGAIVVQLRI